MDRPIASLTIDDPPRDYPADWVEDVVLKDGGTVRIRPIAPADGDALRFLVRDLSAESSYFRFFRVKRDLDDDEVRGFTVLDYRKNMAFIAVHNDRLIAVGRYTSVEDAEGVAEIAFAVADDQQGRGIGTVLLTRLTAYARAHDVTQFRAFMLANNYAMMRVFRDSGFRLTRELDEGVYTVDFPTEESAETRAVEDQHEQVAAVASLKPLFYPKSIAVIGASRNPLSIGGLLFSNLLKGDFEGPVYPVNPKSDVVRSVKAYPTVLDCPGPVDLAFIVVPGPYVIPAVEQCRDKDVKALVVISAGFSETGEEGKAEEERLLSVVRNAGMRMVGPNCMGIINTDPTVKLDGQFGPMVPPVGNVAMSSQSGALGLAILDHAAKLNIGLSMFISVGNKADLSGNDLLLFWENHPATDVILLYLESFGNPRHFSRIAKRVGKRKPVIAVKSGRTAAGARAASSHTGALASLDVAVDAVFRQAGVVRTDTLQEMFDVTALLANQPVPKGKRVGLVTNAGGPAILAVDALESAGMVVPEFSADLQAALKDGLPADASARNPVDMIAGAKAAEYRRTLDLLLESDEVDAVIALYIPASPVGKEEVAAAIRDAGSKHAGKKTFLSVYMHSPGAPPELAGDDVHVPAYPFPERAAYALEKAIAYGEWRDKDLGALVHFADVDKAAGGAVVSTALDRLGDDGGWLEPDEVEALLSAYGLAVPKSATVATADEAVAAAAGIGGPVALKVISPSAVHKSDVGGVALDVAGEDAVRASFEQVWGAVSDPEGVLVQEFVAGGHEVLIGTVEDPNFGPLIVFGLGGVFVELIGDVAFRIHPLTDVDAREMMREVKSFRLLEGYRGGPEGDIAAVEDALLRVSTLVEDRPEISEMDLNPVKVREPGKGATVVDARIKVKRVDATRIPSRDDLASSV